MADIQIGEMIYPDIELIIFDKDGTLIDLQPLWGKQVRIWAGRLLEEGLPKTAAQQFFKTVGFDDRTNLILPDSPLAVAPMEPLVALTAGVFYQYGRPWPAAEELARRLLTIDEEQLLSETRPLGPITATINALAAAGVQIAIATNDDRQPTLAVLPVLGIEVHIAAVVCGDDPIPNKPDPAGFFHICSRLDAQPAKTIMVGDSGSDMIFGRRAGAAACIGIDTGSAYLPPLADQVIPTIASIRPI